MITYECTECGNTTSLQNTKSQESIRTVQPCSQCGDVTCFELADELPEEIDDEAREMLRAVNKTVLVKRNYTGNKHLHIKQGDMPLCESDAPMREVSIQTFPKGYHDWCQHCLSVARDGNGMCAGGTKNDEQRKASQDACLQAIRHANDEIDGKLTQQKYREWANNPSIYRIREHFGKWSTARDKALGGQE